MEINNHKSYSRCRVWRCDVTTSNSIQDGGALVVNILVFDLRVQLQYCTYQRKTLLFALIKVSTFICKREILGCSSPLKDWSVSDDLASWDKLFHSMAPLYLKLIFKNSLLGFRRVRSASYISGATHRKGHTLDIIITQRDDNLVSDVKILQDIYSDHLVITCKLNCPKPPLSKVLVSYRSTKLLDTDELSKIISIIPIQLTLMP